MNKPYELQIIDDSSFVISLKKVKFENIDIPQGLTADDEVKIKTKDSYKITKITNDKLELEFRREKFFEPAALFTIEVVLSIRYKLKPSKNEDRKKIIMEDLDKELLKLLAPVTTKASIIISALTSIDLEVPIVDPPFFLGSDE